MIKAETFHLRTISEADLPVLYQHWANIANRGDCYLLEIPSELNIRKCSKRMASGRGKGIITDATRLQLSVLASRRVAWFHRGRNQDMEVYAILRHEVMD